jgi:alanine dehydrogenase
MRIGIPTEIKPKEGRVALVPAAAAEVVSSGHEVLLQSGAGIATGYPDSDFETVGVKIVPDAGACTSKRR